MFRSLLLLVAFVACRAYVAPLPLRAVSVDVPAARISPLVMASKPTPKKALGRGGAASRAAPKKVVKKVAPKVRAASLGRCERRRRRRDHAAAAAAAASARAHHLCPSSLAPPCRWSHARTHPHVSQKAAPKKAAPAKRAAPAKKVAPKPAPKPVAKKAAPKPAAKKPLIGYFTTQSRQQKEAAEQKRFAQSKVAQKLKQTATVNAARVDARNRAAAARRGKTVQI